MFKCAARFWKRRLFSWLGFAVFRYWPLYFCCGRVHVGMCASHNGQNPYKCTHQSSTNSATESWPLQTREQSSPGHCHFAHRRFVVWPLAIANSPLPPSQLANGQFSHCDAVGLRRGFLAPGVALAGAPAQAHCFFGHFVDRGGPAAAGRGTGSSQGARACLFCCVARVCVCLRSCVCVPLACRESRNVWYCPHREASPLTSGPLATEATSPPGSATARTPSPSATAAIGERPQAF